MAALNQFPPNVLVVLLGSYQSPGLVKPFRSEHGRFLQVFMESDLMFAAFV